MQVRKTILQKNNTIKRTFSRSTGSKRGAALAEGGGGGGPLPNGGCGLPPPLLCPSAILPGDAS